MKTVESAILALPTKEQIRILLDQLPSDCTIEDVQHGLFVLQTIRQSKEEIARGEGIPHEEVERQMQQWLTK